MDEVRLTRRGHELRLTGPLTLKTVATVERDANLIFSGGFGTAMDSSAETGPIPSVVAGMTGAVPDVLLDQERPDQERPDQERNAGLMLDLSGMTRLDSAGLALLVAWIGRCRAAGGTLRIVAVPSFMAPLVELYGLQDVFSELQDGCL